VPAVRALLKSGVDIDEVVLEGSYTALQTATAWQSPEVVKLLIDAGADVNKRSVDFGMRPLHLAAQNGHVMIAMLLIKAGAEVNLADPTDGKTPLWFAVDSHLFDSHNMQMVSMLVRSGANVNIVPFDDDAMSPMEMAEDTECEGMLELLRLAPSLVSPPDVEPRFSVGDRVECCIERWGLSWWAPGTIVAHWFRTPDWPPGKYAPYQIKLNDSGNLVFAPEDRDDVIRLVGLTLRDVD
jgi:ankyrin repeat protein